MEEFTLSTGEDSLQVRLERVFDFPQRTSQFGGYDVRGTVYIRCGGYCAHGTLWFSTGEMWLFYHELQAAYDVLAGQARFRSSEGNLDFTLRFTSRGHWTLAGSYQEYAHVETRLRFEMESEQSYLVETLAQLAQMVATYGDNRGVPR